jgi:hypothetical protein
MSEIIEKLQETKNSPKQFDLINSCHNLYQICLQYYSTLKRLEHPKINLITEVLDLLIYLKKNMDNQTYDQNVKTYDEIHGIAYKNIQLVYDYDKENKMEEITEIKDDSMIESL